MCKGRYNSKHMKVYTKIICTRAVRETADREEYFEQLILRNIKQQILFKNQNVDSVW